MHFLLLGLLCADAHARERTQILHARMRVYIGVGPKISEEEK